MPESTNTNSILPPIYSSGIFTLKGKLDKFLSPTTIYTCIAIRKFEELISAGIDIYTEYYIPLGLSQEDYQKDLSNRACIIVVKSTSNITKSFPSTYLASYPSGNGIKYSVKALIVELGALNDDYDLSVIEQKIKDLVTAEIGVKNATIKKLILSKEELIDEASHNRIIAAREANKATITNSYNTVSQLEQQVSDLTDENVALKNYISHHS